VGVAGELHIGGAGVAKGYVNQPELTAEKFIPNPFGEGRLYKSGDLVRYLPEGNLEFLGRVDHQVKIRGYRIEPGEIESVIKQTAKDALVIAQGEGEHKALVAYVICDDLAEVKTRVKSALPDYMVPAAWCALEAFPLNANGKIDRKALPAIDRAATNEYLAPETETEQKLAEIWREILKLESEPSVGSNFFELGGHSLLATRVVSAVSQTFHKTLPVRALFEHNSVRALAAHLEAQSETAHQHIPRAPRDGELPLSFAQQRLWFVDQLEPDSAQYNIPIALRLKGSLDRDAMHSALDQLVARHEVLRTVYGDGAQIIRPAHPVAIREHDLTGDPRQEERVQELAQGEARTTFRLHDDAMLRVSLLALSATEHVLLLTLHHIAADAWSLGILVREFVELYQRRSLPPLPIQYADFAQWQRTSLRGDEQIDYWKSQLADAPPVHSLPLDRPRSARQRFEGGRVALMLGKEQTGKLHELARTHNASLFMVLQAAFALLVGRWSNETDVVMGTPDAGRNHRDCEGLIGLFLNTLVLRTRLDGALTFHDLIEQARETHLAAHQHGDVPFEAIVEALNPERSLVHAPLFQLLINMNNTGQADLSLPGLAIEPLQQEQSFDSKYDITLYLKEQDAGLSCVWAYNSHLFEHASISMMAGELAALIENLTAHPELPVLRHAWGGQRGWKPMNAVPLSEELIHRRIEAQPAGAIALIVTGSDGLSPALSITYGELNARSNRLARHLRTLGIDEGVRVAIYSERTELRIVAVLAILKAGGVYVPLSQELPEKRLEYMAVNAGAKLLLTDRASASKIASITIPALLLEDAACAAQSSDPLPTTCTADSPAHIIYTSGSTGNPKGVLGTHGATVNRAEWMLREFPFGPGERASHITSMAFIRGIWELFTPLCAGVPVVLFDRDTVKEPARFLAVMREQRVSRVVTAPSLMRSLLDQLADNGETLEGLKFWFVSGEALSVDIARRADRALPATRVVNLYGSTEVLSDVLFCDVREQAHAASVPLGKAIDNVAVTIVDSQHNPVPDGVVGQLVVTGRCVALGYEGLEELTKRQFIETPHGRGYRTGDLGRVLPCGNVEYLGRIDHQIKIRGYRIEPGEIEAQLNRLDAVASAVVVPRQVAGETRFVAYLVLDRTACSIAGDGERLGRVKQELKAVLPDYMIPAAFTVLQELPLTVNGKVNRKALPEPDLQAAVEFVEPATPTQHVVAAIWREVLKLDKVSITADFFELGGHSLLATRVASAVAQKTEKKLTVRNIFEHSTVEALAAFLDTQSTQSELAAIPRVSRQEPLVLSFAQQRLWFIDRLEEGSAQYNMPFALRLRGNLRTDALQHALDEIIRRHEVIRTTYHLHGEKGVQVIHPAEPLPIRLVDLTEVGESAVEALLREEAARPFDLASDHMLRVQLLTLAADDHILLFTMHHIASDGWSIGVLVNELVTLYQNAELPPLPVQYADYAAWQRGRMDGAELERQLAYWKRQLAGAPSVHSLPLDRPRPAQQQFTGRTHRTRLGKGMLTALNELAGQHQATLFMVLETAFALLVSRWSGVADVVVGTPVAGRTHRDVEPLIGFFVNTLVLRSEIAEEQTFAQLLESGRKSVLDAFANQDISFEMLVDELKPERRLSHAPVYQLVFVLQNNERVAVDLPELTMTPAGGASEMAKFDLTLSATESEEGLSLSWNYADSLFDAGTIERFAASFGVLVEAIVAAPDARSYALPIVTPAEEAALRSRVAETAHDFPPFLCLHELFERQVEQTPDAVALRFEGRQLTYAELNGRANRLAHDLRARGVGPDVLTGICIERSLEMVIGLLGILKAGGAYVPLDPGYPKDRLVYMLENSGARVVLTQAKLARELDIWSGREVVSLDAQWEEIAAHPASNLGATAGLDDLAYMIYTSGSTGKPKGAMNTHRGICNRLYWMQDEYRLTADDRVLQKTPFSFDVSVWEFFWPLMTGTTLVIARPDGHRDGEYLAQLIADEAITTIHFVPSMLNAFLRTPGLGRCHSLRRVICSGEALPAELARELFRHLRCELHNLYGPTEAAVDVTSWKVEESEIGAAIPIGRPIANTQIWVLDRNLAPVPAGVAGELYIGGVQVGRGYYGRPELTAERFIDDPFRTPGARLYRTGDLARVRVDGVIEYLGRIDDQVKIRGFRIELGEIAAQLVEQPEVDDALVVARGEGNEKRLVAYVVPSSGNVTDVAVIDVLKRALKQQLPEYMIPAAFVLMEGFPLNSNGKIDRKALPEPDWQLTSVYVAPRSEAETELAAIWARLLKLERVGIEDNFFAIGGDSILSIQAVSRANQAGIGITTRQLFEHQTIAALAAHARQGVALEMPQEPMSGRAALLPIQRQFLAEEARTRNHFNQAVLLETPDGFDGRFLREVVGAIYQRHDALRLRFVDGVAEHRELTEEMVAASAVIEPMPDDLTARCSEHQQSFDLESGPLFRAVYFAGENGGRLLLIAHHIVVDGVSWRILLGDIEQAYHQFCAGRPVVLAPKTSSFQQWGAALEAYAQSDTLAKEKAYWLAQYDEPVAALPVDRIASATPPNSTSRRERIRLGAEETQALLHRCAPVYRTTINELLLSGVYLGMRRWTRSAGLRIALEGHGREALFEHLDTTQTVGWFTTIFPLTLSSASAHVADVIKSVKERVRALPNNGIGYGVLHSMAGDEALAARAEANPLQLVFNYFGQLDTTFSEEPAFRAAGESSGSTSSPERARRYQLGLNGRVAGGVLQFALDYSVEQYLPETMAELASFIEEGLRQVIEHCLSLERGAFTPSDFPLAAISQALLDEWQTAYPSLTRLYPATAMQQGMLFHSLLDSGAYITQTSPIFAGPLDVQTFRAAWRSVVARHDIFRTAFVGQETRLHQLVVAEAELPWHEEDWRGLTGDEQRERFEQYRKQDKAYGFDVARPPLQRIALFRLGEERHQVLWSQHHMLLDGWCKAQIHKEVMVTYMALLRGEQPALPSAPDQEAYMRWLRTRNAEESLAYWREYLEPIEAPTPLVVDRRRKDGADARDERFVVLGDDETRRLESFAKANHTTVNTLVQLAWGYLLHRYSGEKHVLFGSVISGRPAEVVGIETMVGLFINTIPVRASFDESTSVAALLASLQGGFQASQEHGYLPLTDVHGCTRISHGVSLFDSLLVFENYPLDVASSGAGAGASSLRIEQARTDERTNYKLSLIAALRGSLTLKFSYATAHFDRDTIERLLGHLTAVLRQLPDRSDVRDIELVTEAEREAFATWNATSAEYPDVCIHELFEAQAAKTPDAAALVIDGQTLTYRALDERANAIAHRLMAEGVGPDTLVGLSCPRSFDLVAGLLGILKAGGAYVPLDPAYPAERLQFMLEDSGVEIVVTTPSLHERFAGRTTILLEDRDDGLPRLSNKAEEARGRSGTTPANLAYVVYTSGSTGAPKGVLVEHRGLVNLIIADIREFGLGAGERALHCMSLSFDAGMEHLFNALCSGATTYMVEPAADLMSVAAEHRITQLRMPVALLEAQPSTTLPDLRVVVVGGEAPSERVVHAWSESARFYNQYGPSECTVTAAMGRLTRDSEVVHMGRFIANQHGYVVDEAMRPCPVGVPGELLIGGAGVARGYLNRDELTCQRFITLNGERVYRTGDFVRFLPDGNLEFIGRRDDQLKIRGYRVELGEIEACLLRQPAVEDAVVVYREHRLVAYVKGAAGADVLQPLRATLPEVMIPADVVWMDDFPLTAHGKVDKRALPRPSQREVREPVPPRSELERTIAEVWCRHLELSAVGIDDQFHDLGGHSLRFMSVVADLRRRGIEVSVRQAMENQTIRTLSEAIAAAAASHVRRDDAGEFLVRLNGAVDGPPLFVVHPFGGKVDCYTGLAASLSDLCSVFGIQAPFNFNHEFSFDDLRQLGDAYISGIKTIQPSGPYHLAGWSAGGTIAYTIAHLLEERGEAVDYLGLFDAPPPGVLTEEESDLEYLLTAAHYADAQIRNKLTVARLSEDFNTSLSTVAAAIVEDETRSRMTRKELETALLFGVNFCRSQAKSRAVRLSIRGTTSFYFASDEKRKVIPRHEVERLLASPLRTIGVAGEHAHLMTGPGLSEIVADAREELSRILGKVPAAI
jgi:amino acid adenylation domain-containing protein/non-ribosomal peptide synthase protein (TIGR01720 family)